MCLQSIGRILSMMAAVVGIGSGRDVSVDTRRRSYPSKGKLALYKPLLHYNSHLKQLY